MFALIGRAGLVLGKQPRTKLPGPICRRSAHRPSRAGIYTTEDSLYGLVIDLTKNPRVDAPETDVRPAFPSLQIDPFAVNNGSADCSIVQ